jgi:hypothetical protein
VRGNFLSSQEEVMNHDQDLTAAERLEALAELLARGVDRLAARKHDRDKSGRENKKPLVRGHDSL